MTSQSIKKADLKKLIDFQISQFFSSSFFHYQQTLVVHPWYSISIEKIFPLKMSFFQKGNLNSHDPSMITTTAPKSFVSIYFLRNFVRVGPTNRIFSGFPAAKTSEV